MIRSFENYNLTKFAGDLTGAATVCALRVPQAMAYGLLSGVKPVHGLYCDLIGPWFYGIFGSSPQISVGTFSIVAIMMSISMGRVSDDYCINYNCKFDQNGTVLASTEANGRSIAGHFGPLLSTNQSCNPTEIETHETHCKVTIISVLQILRVPSG